MKQIRLNISDLFEMAPEQDTGMDLDEPFLSVLQLYKDQQETE